MIKEQEYVSLRGGDNFGCHTERVTVPLAVQKELSVFELSKLESEIEFLAVVTLSDTEIQEAKDIYLAGILQEGEAEAIVLCRRLHPDWFLTDDADARVFAQSMGIETHGSFGFILWCAVNGMLNREETLSAVASLARTSLWITEKLRRDVEAAVDEIFRGGD